MPRAPEYDREKVIDSALQVFWRQGYGHTSVADLVEATGLNPGSLYAAFGSKKGVFLEVLDAYDRSALARVRALREAGRPTLGALRGLFDAIVEETISGASRRGCLAVSALLELADREPDIETRLRRHNENMRRAFADLLAAAQASGEVTSGEEPEALAAFLVNNLWGMRVMCRGCADRRSLEAVVDGIFAVLTRT